MQHKTLLLERNKQIDVFDDVFPLEWRVTASQFIKSSKFTIGWGDSPVPERQQYDHFIHSEFNAEDTERFGIMKHINQYPEITKLVDGLDLKFSMVNLANMSDVNFVHAHPQKKVMLYYVNLVWNEGSHGETQFYSEDIKSIQYTTPYVPGRLVVFDGDIPHTIRPQSIMGPKYRFTFAMIFDNKQEAKYK
jgi:hypothetical protein